LNIFRKSSKKPIAAKNNSTKSNIASFTVRTSFQIAVPITVRVAAMMKTTPPIVGVPLLT
jgi:ribosomal protein L5